MFNFFKKNKNLDNKNLGNKNILLFAGSPRTGSTLLGQIINYHPNCYISNESSFLKKVVQDNKNVENTLQEIYLNAKNQFDGALENDKKYGKTIERYQPKWQSMKHLTNDLDFQKKEIKYLGDKKAGGVSNVYKESPQETINFINNNEKIKIIQIIRNPINAAKSLMKSHNVQNFTDACNEIIEKTYIANELITKVNNSSLQVYYEDLLLNPNDEISKVLKFLDLNKSNNWIKKISTIVKTSDNKIITTEEIEIMNNILNQSEISILDRYK